jgi:uncharacterized integral membrane protein
MIPAMRDDELAGTRADSPSGDDGTVSERNWRLIASVVTAVVLTALVVTWIVRNGDNVEVDWLFGATEAPLALVIIIAAVLGWIVGSMITALVRRRHTKGPNG